MKKTLTLIFLSLFFANIQAKQVDETTAMLVAKNYYQQMTGKIASLTLAHTCLNADASNGVAAGTPIYYAFDVSGDNGFVMVSAEDLVKPIIGYNTHGHFVIQNAPSVVTDWYGKYSKQIAYAKVNLTSTTKEITDQWTTYSSSTLRISKKLRTGGAVGPLLTTTWDQPYPYNMLCPADASSPSQNNGRVLTGCGATAMAQIMKYWSYPTQGTGSNSYASNYGTLSVNFGATTYNWANMPNSVTSANTDVATIMYDCGVAVDMMYGPTESSSYILSGTGIPASCEAAYTAYFGYDATTIQGLDRANYPVEADWIALIQTEMSNNRPIQYAGQGASGGHTFVLDGADGSGNYHINWGWSGIDNGFYSVDALIPAPYNNGNFSSGEEMIVGIQPPNTTVAPTTIALYTPITITPNPIGFLQTFNVNASLINNGSSSFSGYYCAAMFNASGTFIRYIGNILSTGSNPLLAGNYYLSPGLTFSDTTTFVTVPGTYTIGIYYQAMGANQWTLAGQSSYTNPVTVTVSGANDPGIALYSNIVPTPSTFVQGQPASVNVNLKNTGSTTYYGQYEAVLLDLQGNYVESIGIITESNGLPSTYVYIAPYLTFSSSGITSPQGQYILAIAEEAQGTSQYYYCGGLNYSNPILINVVNSEINILAIKEVQQNTIKVYPNPASRKITIDAGEIHGDYTLSILNTVGQNISESFGKLNGQKLSVDVSEFSAGLYTVQLKTESGILNSKFVVQ